MNFTLVAVVAVALAFDFTNGFHDAANAIATSVSTRAVSPRLAGLGSAVFNFAGAFLSLKVAAAVGQGIVDPSAVTVGVVLSAALAMAAGTYAGGWRIVRTLGQRIAKLEPPQGFAAETATATILWLTAHYGFPVSTTQTVSSAVLGAGATSRFSAVRWGIAG